MLEYQSGCITEQYLTKAQNLNSIIDYRVVTLNRSSANMSYQDDLPEHIILTTQHEILSLVIDIYWCANSSPKRLSSTHCHIDETARQQVEIRHINDEYEQYTGRQEKQT